MMYVTVAWAVLGQNLGACPPLPFFFLFLFLFPFRLEVGALKYS